MQATVIRTLILGGVGLLGALIIWQIVAMTLMSDSSLPLPIEVALAGSTVVQSEFFWTAFLDTLAMAAKGFTLALIVGVVAGVIIGWFPMMDRATNFVVEFLKPIPPIVIMPLAVLVLGPTQEMGEFLVFFGCVLPILYQTAAGVRETDPVVIQTSRSYGVGTPEILFRVVLVSASAFIATAVRTAIPISLIVSIVAGMLGGGPGLGQSIQQALNNGLTAQLYALVLIVGLMGLLLQFVSERIEAKVLKWHPSYRTV